MRLLRRVAIAALTLSASAAHAASVVAPPGAFGAEHRGYFAFGPDVERVQVLLHQGLFRAYERRVRIEALRFRVDQAAGDALPVDLPFSEIRLSTDKRRLDAMSVQFDENSGADARLVQQGPLRLSAVASDDGASPASILIRLDRPFDFDPRDGHLVLDWTAGGLPELTPLFDAADPAGSALILMGLYGGQAGAPGKLIPVVQIEIANDGTE